MKTETFIKKCESKNLLINYEILIEFDKFNVRDNIKVLCKKHGEFIVRACHFLSGATICKKCSINQRYIDKFKSIYVNKYDYSLVNIIDRHTLIKIKENDNIFEITPKDLIDGKFGIRYHKLYGIYNKKTTEKFIDESIKIHGSKYDYSEVIYTNNNTKVKIKCNKHNFTFEQIPTTHIKSGFCCPLCKNENSNLNSPLRNTKELFIENAIKIYGYKYDYSEVVYINNKTPVTIIYNNKRYLQRPDSHLQGKCIEKEWRKNRGLENFIKMSIKKHGIEYNYDNSIYVSGNKKVEIICDIHGSFSQMPNSHLSGQGCPTCSESKGEKSIRLFLEYNNIDFEKEFIFYNCRNGKHVLYFDFYLPDYNLVVEFDGKQHFIQNDFFGGRKSFEKLQINDKIKNEFCKNQNINLIRIPYGEYLNIEKILYEKMNTYIKLTQKEKTDKFIEKSREVWGYKYDYLKVEYIDSTTPVVILYKGVEYNQTPTKHLQKKNCELYNNALSVEEFIRRSKETWGSDRFDYSELEYINSYSKIRLFDNDNGIWIEQKSSSHLSGNYPSISKENFIIMSNLVYDFKYDYTSIDVFKNVCNKIEIICPDHGSFKIRAYDHLNCRRGSCPKCVESIIFKEISSFLTKYDFNYVRPYRFKDCKNIQQLPFDFYIPSIRTCIEFYSEQHFKPEVCESLKINDRIKSDYCEEEYINLIRIRYNQIDDIYRILWDNLKEHIKTKKTS